MALIVENGSGLSNAESYISVADADAYHERRGNVSWDAVDDKEAALVKATDYMLGQYRGRWAGYRKTIVQALDWPRYDVPMMDYPSSQRAYLANDLVPVEVRNACASLALRAASESLLADEEQRVASETIGPITTVYDSGSSPAKKYIEIDNMLSPYLAGGRNTVQMVRA